ncbi:MAG: Adenylate and Guanylate cyclase catalytic domain [Thermoanaerobaculia bacterium]|jgi:class 3 adenylate cyclase|nr:Adenylate and Guanylate cyclase catalytic domain [Thermoanaerobaculia bacterium]
MSDYKRTELVLSILSVAGATAACAEHGDESTVAMLGRYYSMVAQSIRRSEGRVIKVLGDGIVIAFPVSQARFAVEDLRCLQERGTNLWQLFDRRCRIQVKVGIGCVISGSFGPPGQEHEDIYGDALNRMFKLPAGDFVLTPALAAELGLLE